MSLFDETLFDAGWPWTPPPGMGPGPGPGLLCGWPPEFFDNEVLLYPFLETVNDRGAPVDDWSAEGTYSRASVQPTSPAMVDPQGRLVVTTQFAVYTPFDIAAVARDRIEWRGRILTVQGPTIDAGGCDVLWTTTCEETT